MHTIGAITIRQSGDLYSLNDLHRASGGEVRHQPALFLRSQQTQDLIAEIQKAENPAFNSANSQISENNSTNSQIKSADLRNCIETKRGANGGTYACRELVIAYAAWISPAFHLKVIRVFLDTQSPQTPDTPIGQKSLGWVHSRPVPRLHFQQPPAVGQNRAGGRTIEAAQTIARAIEDWARHLPDARAAHDLQHAAQTLHALLVTGWTEVDEALCMLSLARHYLNRWQGRI